MHEIIFPKPDFKDGERGAAKAASVEADAHVDGVRIHYRRVGAGPALVLVHGLLGYSFSWRFNMQPLSRGRTVLALDLPGTGYSDRVRGLNTSLRASATRFWRWLDTLHVDRADLVGSSHGGTLIALAAALAPERVRRLVLASPSNPWSSWGASRAKFFASPAGRLALRLSSPFLASANAAGVLQMYGDPSRISPGTVEGYLAPMQIPGTMQHLAAVMKHWTQDLNELPEALERIRHIPTLVLWGDRDRAVDPRSAQEIARRLPQAQVHMFAGVGHLPYEEVPEEFNRAVAEFLGNADDLP